MGNGANLGSLLGYLQHTVDYEWRYTYGSIESADVDVNIE